LIYRKSEHWHLESIRKHGPNVISFDLVTGGKRTPIVGVYIPPRDLTTLEQLHQALARFPAVSKPLVLGDLNVRYENPRPARDEEIVNYLTSLGLLDMVDPAPLSTGHTGRVGMSGRNVIGYYYY